MIFGFIGTGNMGSALARAVRKTTDKIVLSDHSSTVEALKSELGTETASNKDVILKSDCVFLGVKPQMMADVLAPLKSEIEKKKPLLITMAAGLTMETIAELSAKVPIIRIMPNTPVSVGAGVVLYCKNELVDSALEGQVLNALKYAGETIFVPENLMDAGCSVSGCGPAFMFMFLSSIAKGGEKCGLDAETSARLAANTMLGAAKLYLSSNKTPEELTQAVCSPGGSTIQGVYALENGNIEKLGSDAVCAAYKRNCELAGKK